jgi:3-deoxy-D-arabino-heptulosonate 7-phosphate (DAHP) synthase
MVANHPPLLPAANSPNIATMTRIDDPLHDREVGARDSTLDTTRVDDVRIGAVRPLITPALLQERVPLRDDTLALVERSRMAIADVLHGRDDRLVVVVGPCSIHDHDQAIEYGRRLKAVADELQSELLVVMRTYFEKPRTTVGWKGYINDPHLDGSFAINEGLERARLLLLELTTLGLPTGTMGMTKMGMAAIFETRGNDDCHVILRGGRTPNFDAAHVAAACNTLRAAGLREQVMIDVSHGNSGKQHLRQIAVTDDVAAQISGGERRITGVMIESHLEEGRQDLRAGVPLRHGVSITDACIGFTQTLQVLQRLAVAVRARRRQPPA